MNDESNMDLQKRLWGDRDRFYEAETVRLPGTPMGIEDVCLFCLPFVFFNPLGTRWRMIFFFLFLSGTKCACNLCSYRLVLFFSFYCCSSCSLYHLCGLSSCCFIILIAFIVSSINRYLCMNICFGCACICMNVST